MSEEECDDCGVVHGSLDEIVPKLRRRSYIVFTLLVFCAGLVVVSMNALLGHWGSVLIIAGYGVYFAGINYSMLISSLDAVEAAELKMHLAEAQAKKTGGDRVVGSGNYL